MKKERNNINLPFYKKINGSKNYVAVNIGSQLSANITNLSNNSGCDEERVNCSNEKNDDKLSQESSNNAILISSTSSNTMLDVSKELGVKVSIFLRHFKNF